MQIKLLVVVVVVAFILSMTHNILTYYLVDINGLGVGVGRNRRVGGYKYKLSPWLRETENMSAN